MTTQVPYQHQYPTAPPWAAAPADAPEEAPAPPPPAGPVTPWGAPPTEHGRLLVPFPEEMHTAPRAEPPAWWPVIAWTAFLGLFGVVVGAFGAVSAARRAAQARRGRNSVAPYWVAFAVTLVMMGLLGAVTWAVAVPAYLNHREEIITRQVQENIQHDGQLESTLRTTATSANCEPTGPRVDGTRRYECVVALADGRTGTLLVDADDDGRWTAVSTRR